MGRHIFLCGADMEPIAIRERYPSARFVARARVAMGTEADELWGLLLLLPGAAADDDGEDRRPVMTDDGRRVGAAAPAGWRTTGAPAAILAAARYWELSPSYVRRLASATTGDEE